MRAIPILSAAALALGLFTAALPRVALAQAPGQAGADTTVSANEDRAAPYMIMIFANGTIMQMPVGTAMTSEAMKSSKPLGKPILITVSNGKAYMTSDMKMADGTMLYTDFMKHIREMHERN
jgi:hypothetical protein